MTKQNRQEQWLKDFGARLKAERKKQKLTQQALAAKASTKYDYISQIEKGTRNPSLRTLINLLEALDVSADRLIYGIAEDGSISMAGETDNKTEGDTEGKADNEADGGIGGERDIKADSETDIKAGIKLNNSPIAGIRRDFTDFLARRSDEEVAKYYEIIRLMSKYVE